jgi:hypothetical protein
MGKHMTMNLQKEYITKKIDIAEKIQRHQERLEAHARAQIKYSRNWGYVGDLVKIDSELGEIIKFMGE